MYLGKDGYRMRATIAHLKVYIFIKVYHIYNVCFGVQNYSK